MKRMGALLLALTMLLVLTACGGRTAVESSGGSSGSSSVQPEEDPYAQYPYGIQGLTLYEGEDAERGDGVTLIASLVTAPETAEGYFYLNNLYDLGDGHVVVSYTVSEKRRVSESYEEETPEGTNYLVTWDTETGTAGTPVQLPEAEGDNYTYLDLEGGMLWSWTTGSLRNRAVGYDASLQEAAELTVDGDVYGHFNADGSYYYIVKDSSLFRCSTAGDSSVEPISLGKTFAVETLYGLYRGADGEDYALLTGRAGDLQEYRAIVRLSDGEFVYLAEDTYTGSLYCDGPAILYQDWGTDMGDTYAVCLNDITYRYANQDSEHYSSLTVLSNGYLLFTWTETSETEGEADTLHLILYDGTTGALLGTTSFRSEDGSYSWLGDNPCVYPDGESLLLTMTAEGSVNYYYRWEFGESGTEESIFLVEPDDYEPTVAEIDDLWDPTGFTPGECPEELSDLRERADELEERYGVGIYISEECSNMIGGYAIEALSDRELISEALDILEKALSKYPEHFLEQLDTDWTTGIDIYIAGTLIGMGGGNLDYAGGFQTSYNSRQLIVLDCSTTYGLESDIHHELCHVIDDKLDINEDDWAVLNPDGCGDCYTWSYEQFGRDDLMGYTWWGTNTLEDVYFVDDYSMTYPTEDRARIFENVMVDEDEQYIDWESCPNLRAKLNWYAGLIRATFDTDGWEDVPWERYLDTDMDTDTETDAAA